MHIRWGSYTATITASLSLTPGIDPDAFGLRIAPPADGTIPVQADLTLGDGAGGEVVFRDCRASRGSVKLDPQRKVARFTARDRRWKWSRLAPFFGVYNRRDDDFNILDTDAAPRKSAREIGGLLLDAMGETGYDYAALPADQYPYMDLQGRNPARALRELCRQYGILICLGVDDRVRLWLRGQGEAEPAGDRASLALQQDVRDTPEKVVVLGARNRYQEEVELEAIAYDPADDTWKVLSDVGYKPSAGWYPGFEDDLGDRDQQRAARGSVFRVYRLPETHTIAGTVYQREELSRRLRLRTVEKSLDADAAERYRRAYVYGQHATDAYYAGPFGRATAAADQMVMTPFWGLPEAQAIQFEDQVWDVDDSDQRTGATLTLVCTFLVDRFQKEFSVSGGLAGVVDVIERDDCWYEYDAGSAQNLDAADARAAAHQDEHLTRYADTIVDNRTNSYPGIVPFSPDGWALQVSYVLDGSGPRTVISWGGEHNPRTAPEEVREAELDVAEVVAERRAARAANPSASEPVKSADTMAALNDLWQSVDNGSPYAGGS